MEVLLESRGRASGVGRARRRRLDLITAARKRFVGFGRMPRRRWRHLKPTGQLANLVPLVADDDKHALADTEDNISRASSVADHIENPSADMEENRSKDSSSNDDEKSSADKEENKHDDCASCDDDENSSADKENKSEDSSSSDDDDSSPADIVESMSEDSSSSSSEDSSPSEDFSSSDDEGDAPVDRADKNFEFLSQQGAVRNDPMRFPLLADTLAAGNVEADATKHVIRAQSRQSGELGVCWESRQARWIATWYEDRQRKAKSFSVAKYELRGMTHEQAVKAAMEAAVRFRRSKVSTQQPTRFVRGVTWNKKEKRWRVFISMHGEEVFLGCFKPKDHLSPCSVASAYRKAKACRLAAERRYYTVEISAK